MASISKEDKTITIVCQSDDEASARGDLRELLEANPGYTPVLILEDAVGNQVTHTSLEAPTRRSSAPTVVSEPVIADEEAGDTVNDEEDDDGEDDEDDEDEEEDEGTE